MQKNSNYLNRIESLGARIQALTKLRSLVALPPDRDLQKEQWIALESQLVSVANRLNIKLKDITDRLLADKNNPKVRKLLVEQLGDLEMDVSHNYSFFDWFMDVLTQRLSRPIGELILGCDKIAADGLRRGFLADITVLPIVYCDRGFGASICREGSKIIQGVANPIPLIAIPYARLVEKYNLMSIYHEVGHQALHKLNLVQPIQYLFQKKLTEAGAPPLIANLFANWSKELTPDFWAFCLTGMAQTCSLRDILAVTQEMATQISTTRPHPPAFLRFLTSVAWCRHLWGKGVWDDWEKEWLEMYPISDLDETTRNIISKAQSYLPIAAKIMIETRFTKLDNKPLTSLFDLEKLNPLRLQQLANFKVISSPDFAKNPIGVQMAAFRLLRENRNFKQSQIDNAMSEWLKNL